MRSCELRVKRRRWEVSGIVEICVVFQPKAAQPLKAAEHPYSRLVVTNLPANREVSFRDLVETPSE